MVSPQQSKMGLLRSWFKRLLFSVLFAAKRIQCHHFYAMFRAQFVNKISEMTHAGDGWSRDGNGHGTTFLSM
jgi:hypothetical protein